MSEDTKTENISTQAEREAEVTQYELERKKHLSVRACVMCKHYAKSIVKADLCIRKIKVWRDVVTGQAEIEGQTLCNTERKGKFAKLRGLCGKAGRFFEENV